MPKLSVRKQKNLAELDALIGPPSSSVMTESNNAQDTTKGIEVLGRCFTKRELLATFLQATNAKLIAHSQMQKSCIELLTDEKFQELVPAPNKHFRIGKEALSLLKEAIEHQLTDLMYLAHVMVLAQGKVTIDRGHVQLARLIQTRELGVHGNRQATQEALMNLVPREGLLLGQDVNIDSVYDIVQEALNDGPIHPTRFETTRVHDLRRRIEHVMKKRKQGDVDEDHNEPPTKKSSNKKRKEKIN